MPRKRTGYDAACYYDGKLLGRCTKADSDAYTLLMNACGGDAARVLREYINRSITQMQLMQSCVWVIFCFRPPHQIVAGNTVIVSQHQNAIRADVLAVIRFIFAECGF